MSWEFYGRDQERDELRSIVGRRRWFFARITGRRRIGKTTLVQQALKELDDIPVFYVQIPDSAPAGVLSAVADALDTFSIDEERFPRPKSLLELAQTVKQLAEAGFVVALDEFQYFSRKALFEFTSHLQAVVDDLSSTADCAVAQKLTERWLAVHSAPGSDARGGFAKRGNGCRRHEVNGEIIGWARALKCAAHSSGLLS